MSEVGELILPTEKVKASRKNPRVLILYGAPKVGKTTLASQLKDNLLIDLENGSDFVDAIKLRANNLVELKAIGDKIIKEGRPYKKITIDSLTKLEELCEAAATKMYMATGIGKNFDGKSVLELPSGAGYFWLRQAFSIWKNYIESIAGEVIYIAHLKEKMIEKAGKEVSSKEVDLTGKLKAITCSNADATGYVYRTNDGKIMVNFKSSEEVVCGSRCDHLRGQEFEFDWNKIYLK